MVSGEHDIVSPEKGMSPKAGQGLLRATAVPKSKYDSHASYQIMQNTFPCVLWPVFT